MGPMPETGCASRNSMEGRKAVLVPVSEALCWDHTLTEPTNWLLSTHPVRDCVTGPANWLLSTHAISKSRATQEQDRKTKCFNQENSGPENFDGLKSSKRLTMYIISESFDVMKSWTS